MMRSFKIFLILIILTLGEIMTVQAEPNIKVVKTPKGLTAWLVESHTIPMISVDVSFRAGAAFDGEGMEGLASFTASLMGEGAANMDAKAFKEKLDSIGARFASGVDKLDFSVYLDTMTEHKEKAFKMLGQAITAPRFDAAAVKRIKEATLADLKRGEEDPGTVAARVFNKTVFQGHVYGHASNGKTKTVEAFSVNHVRDFYKEHLTKNNMVISVVGDITPEELSTLLDNALAGLPAGRRYKISVAPKEVSPVLKRIQMPVPQSTIYMGHLGISRDDPDYYASYVMNQILGGGGFSAYMMEEVREKRGLAYYAYSSFSPLPYAGSFMARAGTKNENVDEAVQVMKDQMSRIINTPVNEKVFKDTLAFLTGSFPLKIDSNRKILGYLSTMQMENLGQDYLTQWIDRVKAVKLEDIQRVAKRLLSVEELIVIIVGGEAEVKQAP